jgi:hypothetical protein
LPRSARAAGPSTATRPRRAISILVTFNTFALAGIFFRAPEFSLAIDYFHRLLSFSTEVEKCTPFVVLLVASSVAAQFLPGDTGSRMARRVEVLGPVALGLVLGAAFWRSR